MSSGSLTDALRETLGLFDDSGAPLTTTEAADRLELGRRSTYERLKRLVDHGEIETKAVGANGRVWWRPRPETTDRLETGNDDLGDYREREDVADELGEVYERIDDAFAALDEHWRYTHVNEHAEDLLQLGADELLGKSVWELFPETIGARFEEECRRAVETNESVEFEEYYAPLDGWFEVRIYPSESGLSFYFKEISDRKARELELEQYETVVETVDDAIYVTDAKQRYQLVNDGYCELVGRSREELLGAHISTVVDEDVLARAARIREEQSPGKTGRIEFDLVAANGETHTVETRYTLQTDNDGGFAGSVGVLRDVTERRERERELASQRERLAALDDLNRVVRELSRAVIDQSTREQIELTVCETLAASESYLYAWIGEPDSRSNTIRLRTEAGVEGYLDDFTIYVDPDDPRTAGISGRAIQSHEMQVVNDVRDPSFEVWAERGRKYGFRSSATIPIVHEHICYGLLNVYAARPNAFTGDEGAVVAHLGEVIGHAIAAVERGHALTSDEVVELEFRVPNALDALDLPQTTVGLITFDRFVPIGDDTFLTYGTVTDDMHVVLDTFVDAVPHWESVTTLGRDRGEGDTRFEARLVDPPVLSEVTNRGGYVERASIEDGDYLLRIHLSPSGDASQVIDVVREAYPTIQMMTRRQVTRESESLVPLSRVLTEELTERQRAALEAGYFAGYFEWPRETKGKAVAESLGISPATYHQHLRAGQRKLLSAALDDLTSA